MHWNWGCFKFAWIYIKYKRILHTYDDVMPSGPRPLNIARLLYTKPGIPLFHATVINKYTCSTKFNLAPFLRQGCAGMFVPVCDTVLLILVICLRLVRLSYMKYTQCHFIIMCRLISKMRTKIIDIFPRKIIIYFKKTKILTAVFVFDIEWVRVFI